MRNRLTHVVHGKLFSLWTIRQLNPKGIINAKNAQQVSWSRSIITVDIIISVVSCRLSVTLAFTLFLLYLFMCETPDQLSLCFLKACGCPLYWKAPMFNAAGGERTGFVSVHSFIATWRK